MKTVTYEEFLEFDPCWLEDEGGEGVILSMEFLLFESLYDTAYQLQVYELLKKCDQEFVPPFLSAHRQRSAFSAIPLQMNVGNQGAIFGSCADSR